ncbi:tyrosine-type recombinase/integrase [Vibrio taketomensis]|uniref:tyrosine-type recombinase/integrase n=1 Tax=Vibrio taketomensis TaxID=2572923 RepID=UPI001389CE40|nr:tyrosine-type recombinase/integrase [Vibrio taketomensis]
MKKKVPVVTQPQQIKILTETFSEIVDVEAMNQLTSGLYASSSLLALTKDWNMFVEFCQNKNVRVLPASTTAVRLYIEKVSQERKYASVKRYVITISLIHRVLSYPDPTQNSRVQTALGSIRVTKHGDHRSTTAFTVEHLNQLDSILEKSRAVKDWRDLAIYYVMYEGLLKRHELRDLTFEQLHIDNEYISMFIGSEEITFSQRASFALFRWLKVRGCSGKFVFTAIDRHENIGLQPLNDSSIYRILRNASDLLGLDYHFSGQSLRVGATQELARQGVNIREIQQAGRWLSPAMPYQYIGNKGQAELEKLRFVSFKFID